MKIEHDQDICEGRFRCIQHWDDLKKNYSQFRIDIPNGEKLDDHTIEQEIAEEFEDAVKEAAQACPTDAITVYEDGEQIIP